MAINLTKNEEQLTAEVMGKINLSKDKEKLEKHVVNLSKCMVNLSKKAEVDLGITKARVIVALDYSGSMGHLYRNGTVQKTLNKLVPLGLTFDDNGEIEVYLFQNGYRKVDEMTLDNYSDYVKDVIDTCGYDMGGTEYAPVLKAIRDIHKPAKKVSGGFLKGLFKKKVEEVAEAGADENIFVIFITDGDNFDKAATDDIVRELSHTRTFIQFVGIGSEKFKYLQKLDDLTGRPVDNTGFTKFNDVSKVDDTELYSKVLEQFADWLKVI